MIQYRDPDSSVYKEYNFDGYIDVGGGRLIPINAYAFDNITPRGQYLSLILKLNEEFPIIFPY